ncbi:hypothetical protein VKT23_010460 [Stygiomarasmius scandens]|uniref:F-box domain-containing protein n=1 Tax=Marasmiellus scandens TaxID=2682957 RepID=A0ABR1JGF7_9AGAR
MPNLNPSSKLEFPPEIIEKIILSLWTDNSINLSSSDRILFMTTCPLLNKTWKAQFSRIASRDIYIPRLSYLLYLASVAWRGNIFKTKSLVYSQHRLKKRAETMTLSLDLRSCPVSEETYDRDRGGDRDKKNEEIYWLLTDLQEYSYSKQTHGLRRFFPTLKQLKLKTAIRIPMHLWTSPGAPQVAYTEIVLGLDPDETLTGGGVDDGDQRVKLPLDLNIAIHVHANSDSDDVAVTDALWKYRASLISAYLGQLVNVTMGGLISGVGLSACDHDRVQLAKVFQISELLHKSRMLEGSVHFFSTSMVFHEPPRSDVYRIFCPNFSNLSCPEQTSARDVVENKKSLSSHPVCTPLCRLRSWRWSYELGELKDRGGWDLIIPYSALDEEDRRIREICKRRELEGVKIDANDPSAEDCAIMRLPQVLRWYTFSPFAVLTFDGPSPFTAMEDLRKLVESGIGYD